MTTDFETLKDILEIAEVLSNEGETSLEVLTYNEPTGNSTTVVFEFNEDQELVNIYTED